MALQESFLLVWLLKRRKTKRPLLT
ncbi:Phosphoenolpyruvate carboxylase [Bienertia sinuspersici]